MGLKKYFIETISQSISGVRFNGHSGSSDHSTYTLVSLSLPISQEKAKMLLFNMDIKGIAISQGSACQSGSDVGSHVLKEVLDEEDLKKPSFRFSFSKYNTTQELDYTIGVLKEFIKA
jgi:cysteine desulfurase